MHRFSIGLTLTLRHRRGGRGGMRYAWGVSCLPGRDSFGRVWDEGFDWSVRPSDGCDVGDLFACGWAGCKTGNGPERGRRSAAADHCREDCGVEGPARHQYGDGGAVESAAGDGRRVCAADHRRTAVYGEESVVAAGNPSPAGIREDQTPDHRASAEALRAAPLRIWFPAARV